MVSVMQPTIFMGTIDRGAENYVQHSVTYALDDPSVTRLHLLVGSPHTEYLGALRDDPRITLHHTTDAEWAALTPVAPKPHIARQRQHAGLPPTPPPSPHLRQSWNMCRALDDQNQDGVIILEDDIELTRDWHQQMTAAASQIASRLEKDAAFLLTGFVAYHKELRVTSLYGRIPGPFSMSQCVYLSEAAAQRRDLVREAARRMPFDLALNVAADSGKKYVLPISVVNHRGDVSTMGNPPGRRAFRWRSR